MRPRLLLTMLAQHWFRRFPSYANQRFVRDTFRKCCVSDELLIWTAEGFQMLASPHDYGSYEIFFFGVYDPMMTSLMKAQIPEGATCWDVGAYSGWFSLLMGQLVGPSGRVDAFEAFPPNFDKLKINVALNGFGWVHPYNLAVSNHTGQMHFVPPSDEVTHYASYLRYCSIVGYLTQNAMPGSIEVATTTLDEHAENTGVNRLDFIKIDVEGAEVAALLGAQKTLQRFRPKIAIEYNRETARRAGTSMEELDNLLDSIGYDRFNFWGRLEKLRLERWKDLPDNETVFNVYCFPRK
jgi:FkbM family methyltransferase